MRELKEKLKSKVSQLEKLVSEMSAISKKDILDIVKKTPIETLYLLGVPRNFLGESEFAKCIVEGYILGTPDNILNKKIQEIYKAKMQEVQSISAAITAGGLSAAKMGELWKKLDIYTRVLGNLSKNRV